MKLACILLAAGFSVRFGGDKRLYPVDGVPMLERALSLYAALPFFLRVLVVRPGEEAIRACGERYGFTVIENPLAAQGIGTSAACGVRALPDDIDGALFAVCDQPYLTGATVESVLDAFFAAPDRIVAPCFDGKRGNPVLFPADLFPALAALDGETGGGAVVRRHPERLLTVPAASARELSDIDTQEGGRPC